MSLVAWPYYATARIELACGHTYMATADIPASLLKEICTLGMWCKGCAMNRHILAVMTKGAG